VPSRRGRDATRTLPASSAALKQPGAPTAARRRVRALADRRARDPAQLGFGGIRDPAQVVAGGDRDSDAAAHGGEWYRRAGRFADGRGGAARFGAEWARRYGPPSSSRAERADPGRRTGPEYAQLAQNADGVAGCGPVQLQRPTCGGVPGHFAAGSREGRRIPGQNVTSGAARRPGCDAVARIRFGGPPRRGARLLRGAVPPAPRPEPMPPRRPAPNRPVRASRTPRQTYSTYFPAPAYCSASTFFARLGCTRGGSPGIFG
jgi:hypothetical protein